MLRAMVTSAVTWMQIGLPLQCLKIVLYVKKGKKIGIKAKSAIEVFQTLKTKIEKKTTILKVGYVTFSEVLR